MNQELNVLLVDDDRLVRYVTGAYFKRIGHHLDMAENGMVAIDKARLKDYDLILMDVRMPVMNGLDATKAIRAMETESGNDKRARIVAITASSAREECLGSGMNDYFQKPIMMDQIHQILSDM